MRRFEQNGFTLPELLIVSVLLIILASTGLFLLHPKNYNQENRNARRQLDIALIADGLKAYVAHTGSLPAGVTNKWLLISSEGTGFNLCPALVPVYLRQLPVDPIFGMATSCNAKLQYLSGYAIKRAASTNGFMLKALVAEGKTIQLTVSP